MSRPKPAKRNNEWESEITYAGPQTQSFYPPQNNLITQASNTDARTQLVSPVVSMEEKEVEEFDASQRKCTHSYPNLQEMIIEYTWAHKMKDVGLQEVVDASAWIDVKEQRLTLREPWRLRVASAQAYSVVKKRDVEHYERVISYLDATYRLLPGLVVPIKHMKIMFGLKTMIIMWMLRQGQNTVPIIIRILQLFPSKLPQYQDHCTNHQMFLMRKNHLDFKLLAQSLAMDKKKNDDYVQNEMEEQYGEHYAQKVEDRLVHYLQELEMALPRDTYIDKMLRQEHSLSLEQKRLLDVITCGSTPIAVSLRRTLCHACRNSAQAADVERVHPTEKAVNDSASWAAPRYETGTAPEVVLLTEAVQETETASQRLSQDSPLLFAIEQQEEGSNERGFAVGRPKPVEGLVREAVGREAVKGLGHGCKERGLVEGDGSGRKLPEEGAGEGREAQISSESERASSSSLQFCSKHQCWVRSILLECTEELQTRSDVTSPPLIQSSSSSSSQDLTPSLLVHCRLNHQHAPLEASSSMQETAQGPRQTTPTHNMVSGSPERTFDNITRKQSLQPLCSSGGVLVATAPVCPSQCMSPSHSTKSSEVGVFCNTVCKLFPAPFHVISQVEPALSLSKADASLNPLDPTQWPTIGPSPEAVRPQLAPCAAIPGQPQQALATTLPAPYLQTVCVAQSPSSCIGCLPPARKPFSRFSRKGKQPPSMVKDTSHTPTQLSLVTLPERRGHLSRSSEKACLHSVPPAPSSSEGSAQVSSSSPMSLSLVSTARAALSAEPAPGSVRSPQSASTCAVSVATDIPSEMPESVGTCRSPTVLPAQGGCALPHLQLLPQPCVRLTRLNPQEYSQVTEWISPPSREPQPVDANSHHYSDGGEEEGDQEEEGGEDSELVYLQFDPNLLFSSDDSSGSDLEDSQDPDYIP